MADHKLKGRWRALGIAGLLVGLYALFGFVAVPKLLRHALIEAGGQTFGIKPALGHIAFNPLLLQLEIRDCSLADTAGAKLVGFERLFVDFELASLWHRAFVFKTIELTAPFLNAAVSSGGRLNLTALEPAGPPQPKRPSGKSLPRIQVDLFRVARGSVSYADASRRTPFASRLQPIDFELRDFTTGVEGGRFRFSGVSRLNERIEWRGVLSVQPIASSGEFRIQGLQARTVWDYFKDRLGFVVNSGLVDIAGQYRFAMHDPIDLQVEIARLASTDLAISPDVTSAAWISLPQLTVASTAMNLAQRLVRVTAIELRGLGVRAWRNADGSFNLGALATTKAAVVPAGAATAAPGAAAAGPVWRFELGSLTIADAQLSAEDRTLNPAAAVLLAPVNLQLAGVSSDLSRPVQVMLNTSVNGAGRIALQGELRPDNASGAMHLQITDFDLRVLQPYIAQQAALSLVGGQLQLSGDLHSDLKQRKGPAPLRTLGFTGDLSVDNLRTIDNALRRDLVRWQRLELRGLKFQSDPGRLSIAQADFREPYARVIIAPDRTLNIARVLSAGPAPAGPKAATAPRSSAATVPGPRPMAIAIRAVSIEKGTADFTDLSIQPNFAAGIQALEGTVLGLSSDPASRARVKLRGQVDAYSPVAIDGDVNIFSAALFTDLRLSFQNMELTTFNPYSGKFAGYNISKGKLTTQLHYQLQDRKLIAEHHVTIDQLEFGAKTDSKEAVSLPVKLAVALLKDRRGVIDINLPVSGTLDDPQFRLGPIIWKVLVNLLVKAVSAPFALLGSLFGGGPDLQYIDFSPGEAVLDGPAQAKLAAVGKALVERPQLKIELPIAVMPALDRGAIIDAHLRADADAEMQFLKLARGAAPGAGQPELAALEPAMQFKVLAGMYQRRFGAPAKYPESARGESPQAVLQARLDYLRQALRAAIVVPDTELRALAQQRAEAVQKSLLADGQIDPTRVFLILSDKARALGERVRLELTLQ